MSEEKSNSQLSAEVMEKVKEVAEITQKMIDEVEKVDNFSNVVITFITGDPERISININGTTIDPDNMPLNMIRELMAALTQGELTKIASTMASNIVDFMSSHGASITEIISFFRHVADVTDKETPQIDENEDQMSLFNEDEVPFKPTLVPDPDTLH